MVHDQSDGCVEFAYYRPAARSVHLAGDFNGWRTTALRLMRDADGWWRTQLQLPPGSYAFRYFVDEQLWEADFAAFGVEPQKDGHFNSILYLPERRPAVPAAKAA